MSPLQELPATTRSSKNTKSKKLSKKTTAEPPSKTNTFPKAVTPSSEALPQTAPNPLSEIASEVPLELPTAIASGLSSELSSGISSEAGPGVPLKSASEVSPEVTSEFSENASEISSEVDPRVISEAIIKDTSENSSSPTPNASLIIDPPITSDTTHSSATATSPSQPHALVHIWLDPTAGDLEAGHSKSNPSVTLTVPLPTINEFLTLCKHENHSLVAASASSIPSGSSTARKGFPYHKFERMTRARTAKLMLNDTATQTLITIPPKRKLNDEELMDQPSAKRSKSSKPDDVIDQPSTKRPTVSRLRPIRKVRAKINQATGRVEGTAYTVDGQLVLDPYQPDVVIENSDDEAIPFDSERVGFFDVPDAIRKRFTKKAKSDESQSKENDLPIEVEQESVSQQILAVANNLSSSIPDSQVQPEVKNEDQAVTQADVSNQPAAMLQPAPATPRPTREWGLGSLARSVSRYVPSIPSFGRRRSTAAARPTLDATPASTPSIREAPLVAASTPVVPATHVSTQPENPGPNTETLEVQHVLQTGPNKARTLANNNNAHITAFFAARRAKKGENWKSMQKVKAEQEEQRRKLILAANKKVIDEEVARKVTAALREAEKNQPGEKRKRYSPDIIPNPIGSSYGMDTKYFWYSSSDDEEELEEPTPIRSTKRVRFQFEAPLTPPKQMIGDPSQATPYTGATFADPKPNVFDAVEYIPGPTRTFTVPYSDSESDEESSPNSDAPSQSTPNEGDVSTSEPESWVQSPPPRPNPSHAALPAANAISSDEDALPTSDATSDQDALSRARSQALRYTPKQPSGLRASSRLSSSTVASEIGSEPDLDEVPGTLAVDQDQPQSGVVQEQTALSVVQEQSGPSVVPDQKTQERLDLEVAEELARIPEEDLIKFIFPRPKTYADAGIVGPEVQASLDSLWTAEDEEKAERLFEAEFSKWKAQRSPDNSHTLT